MKTCLKLCFKPRVFGKKQTDEFVSADAADQVARPCQPLEYIAYALQRKVAFVVAEGVVDLLEVIQINKGTVGDFPDIFPVAANGPFNKAAAV